jgi:hypothetical protein
MKLLPPFLRFYLLTAALLLSGLGFGQVVIYTQDFETNLTGYSHTPSQTPSIDPTDQYFHRAEPGDPDIYEGSVGPYTNVTGSWLFVGSNPNDFNSGNPGILSLGSGIDVSGFTDLELSIDFGAVPNDWDGDDDLSVEYSWDNAIWSVLYNFNSGATNQPLDLTGNSTGGTNTANGTTLTYALQTIVSTNFTGSGTMLYLRVVCDSEANYEAFGLDNVVLEGTSSGPTISVSETAVAGLNYIEGSGPSNSQSLEVTGSNLDGTNVTITAPVNFEISDLQTGTYGNNLVLNSYDGSPSNIWVRLQSGLSFGNYTGNLEITGGGALQVNVAVDGNVTGGIIVQQDFDSTTPEWNYTNDVPFFDNTWGTAFYGTISSSAISPLNNSSFSGNILGENDLQNTPDGTTGVATLSFENINISGYTNVQLSFDYQFVDYNANDDEGSYEIFENETGQGLVFLADGSTSALENTSGSETIPITTGINEISLNYILENDGASGFSGLDNVILTGLANDTDTDINPPVTQVASGDIIVDEALDVTNSVPVFKFDVQDIGGDGLETELTHVRVIPGPNNTANWSDVIEGVRLEGDGLDVNQGDQILTITDDELIIEITALGDDEMIIPNGTSKEYTINVFIDSDFAVEGQVIQMAIDDGNDHFFVNPSGSMISRNISGFEGNEHTIEIEGNKLEFIINPSTTIINEAMGTVQVAYTDDEGRVDTDFDAQVNISSTGTMTGDPIPETAVNGIASFSNLVHTSLGSSLTLTASSSGETDIISSNFNIIALPELFISEVTDPDDISSGKYVEIYNAGVTAIDFDVEDYYIVRESNGGTGIFNIKLEGTIDPKAYFTISRETAFNSAYGFLPNINDPEIAETIAGNGNDSYFISIDNTDNQALRNSMFDIYGEIGIDGENPVITPWEYKDSRAYRNNPTINNANTTWTASEWTIESNANLADMTPGYGDNDYIYDNGNWNTNIYLNTNPDGVIEPNRNIFIKSGIATLTSDTEIGDLVVRSGATLELEPGVKLTVTGDIVNEGTIIFQSDVNGSAVLEAVQPNTRVVGNGFEIHRYIPAKRAFRYLSSAVNSTDDINANWQEGLTNTGFNYPTDNNPGTAGLGTHITGTDLGNNKGFDATESGNPSMFTWNVATQTWNSIPSTNSDFLEVGRGYAILVRGDRLTSLTSNDAVGNDTRLRSTGEIHTGDFMLSEVNGDLAPENAVPGNTNFNLIGNPYQSQVDLKDLLDNHSNQLNPNIAYVYDPTLGERGGYATIDLENTSFSSVPAGTTANQYLQPNQAFFVESIGVSPNLTFTEDTKNNGILQTQTFSTETNPLSYLNINLKDDTQHLLDGVRVVFGENYSEQIDNLDAFKFWNYDENLSVFSKNTNLSIEKRPAPVATDTTHLHLYSYTKTQYRLETEWVADTQENMQVFLVDQYEDQSLEITPNQSWSYHFSVNAAIPESVSPTRFLITYETNPLSLDDFSTSGINVYPNPLPRGQSLYLQTDDLQDIQHIQLLNLQGQVVQNVKVDALVNSANRVEMNFKQGIQSGVYLLKFQTSTHHFVKKIIFK